MKATLLSLSLMGALLAGAGCASSSRAVVQKTVGPCNGTRVAGATHGQLVVYSCWDFRTPADYDYVARAPYEVYSPAGELVQAVSNDAGGYDRNPVVLSLPNGEYKVASFVPGLGQTTLPVRIQPGLTTKVYLDGSANHRQKDSSANLVKLPDGDIAGCAADGGAQQASVAGKE